MATTEDPRALRRGWTAVATAFAAHATLSGLIGPWIPHLKERNGLDDGGLGIALAGLAAGLLVGTRLAGPAIRRAGARAVVRIGVPALGVGVSALSATGGLVALASTFLAIGLASGLADVAMNVEAVAVERRFGRRVMTAIHGVWSVSVFAGAGIASLGIALGAPIRLHLAVSAAVLVLGSFWLLRWLPVRRGPDRAAAPQGAPAPPTRVVLLCLLTAAGFLVEGIALEWSALYLRGPIGATAATAGFAVVAFAAGMATSRFLGDRFVGRHGQPVVVRTGAAAAGLAMAILIAVDDVGVSLAAFAVVGLGLGPAVPLAFRTAGSLVRRRGVSALPIVVTSGYVGSVVGPLVVGFVADAFGLRAGFAVPLLACVAVAVAATATIAPPTAGPGTAAK